MEIEPDLENEEIESSTRRNPKNSETRRRTRPFLTMVAFLTLAAGGVALAWLSVFLAQKLQTQSESQPVEIRYLGQDTEDPFPIELIDSLGASTVWTETPHRIVSLAPSLTSMVTFWGGDSRVVGITRYCKWAPDQRPVKKIGGMTDPNLESIHTLKPDLILASTLTPGATLNALRSQFSKKLVVFSHSGWSGVEKDNRAVAALLGTQYNKSQPGKDLIRREQELRKKSKAIEEENRRTLLLLYGSEGLYTCGPGSFAHDLIQLAGINNVTRDQDFEWAQISIESVLLWDPDWILVTDEHQDQTAPSVERLEDRKRDWIQSKKEDTIWKKLRAIQNEQIIWTNDTGWTTPGPASLSTAEQLHEVVY